MANTTVTQQPGISYQKEYSGSVQYIGGYDGPYVNDADVFVQQASGSSNHVPIPMGLEVFENVSKFVAHQIVAKEDGKWGLICSRLVQLSVKQRRLLEIGQLFKESASKSKRLEGRNWSYTAKELLSVGQGGPRDSTLLSFTNWHGNLLLVCSEALRH